MTFTNPHIILMALALLILAIATLLFAMADLRKARKPLHLREPPHCPSCSCGMPVIPEQTELDPDAKRALYGNLRRLYRR